MSAALLTGSLTGCDYHNLFGGNNKSIQKQSESTSKSSKTDKTMSKELLNKEYIKRMKAYLTYFEDEEKNYSGTVAASITLDENSLPLLWLVYSPSDTSFLDNYDNFFSDKYDGAVQFQLCNYEDNAVHLLAEKRISNAYGYILLSLNPDLPAIKISHDESEEDDFDNYIAYVYDKETDLFTSYDFTDFKYSGKNPNSYIDKTEKNMDVFEFLDSSGEDNSKRLYYFTIVNSDESSDDDHRIMSYIGLSDDSLFYETLLTIVGAIEYYGEIGLGYTRLAPEYMNNQKILDIVNKYLNYKIEKKNKSKEYVINSLPNLYLEDGTKIKGSNVSKHFDIKSTDYNVTVESYSSLFTFLLPADNAKMLMRYSIKHPQFTAKDILETTYELLMNAEYVSFDQLLTKSRQSKTDSEEVDEEEDY